MSPSQPTNPVKASDMDHNPLNLPPELLGIHLCLEQGGRITTEQARMLLAHGDLLSVAAMAEAVARRKWSDEVFYSQPTRVSLVQTCDAACAVCGPHVDPETRAKRAAETAPHELHLVGLPSSFDLSRTEQLLATLRARLPDTWIMGFGPRDVAALARSADLTPETAATRLQQAGLDGLLGAHDEVYTPAGRRLLGDVHGPSASDDVVTAACFRAGLVSVASMAYAPGVHDEDVVARLDAIREVQRGRGGFSVFAPMPVDLEGGSRAGEVASGYEDVKIVAVSRLFLDNVPHIRVPWLALGLKMGQVALSFGADDLGWAPLDGHVRAYSPPTSFTSLGEGELRRTVTAARRQPVAVDGAWRPRLAEAR